MLDDLEDVAPMDANQGGATHEQNEKHQRRIMFIKGHNQRDVGCVLELLCKRQLSANAHILC